MNLEDYWSSTSIARTMMKKHAFLLIRSFFDIHECSRWRRRRLDNCVVYSLNCIWRTRVAAAVTTAAKKDQWFRETAGHGIGAYVLLEKSERRNARFLRFTYRKFTLKKWSSLSLSFFLHAPAPPCLGSTTALNRLSRFAANGTLWPLNRP